MKRPDSSQVPKKGTWACADPEFVKKYPSLAEGMCDPWWEDGKPRDTWTLTIRIDRESVNLCLNDKQSGQGAYTTGGTLSEALELLNGALKAGTLAWRRWKK